MGKRKMPPKEQGKQRKVQNSGRLQDGRTSQGNKRPQVDRRAQNSRNEFEDPYYNPAKSLANNKKNSAQSRKSAKSPKGSEHRAKTNKKDILGLILELTMPLLALLTLVIIHYLSTVVESSQLTSITIKSALN